MSTVAEKSKTASAPTIKFGIQADHPRNSDLLIQCIPGCVLRSAINAMRTVKDAKTGEERIPVDQARHLGLIPSIPGMELHVNAEEGTYVITDPLNDEKNAELRTRLRRALKSGGMGSDGEIRGAKTVRGELDPHRMKTLCREMLNLVHSGEARVVKGAEPSYADVDALPGKYLLNPGSRVQNLMPEYEEDYGAWLENLKKYGG